MATIYPKDFFDQTRKRIQKASCFVIMPFGQKFREVYDTLKITLESDILYIECNRADDFHQPHIIETILKGIERAEFVIADLTESNANVFYELGLVHSFKDIDKVIILTQDMKFVPFDLQQFRCIVYEQSIDGFEKLKVELVKTFKEMTKDSFRLQISENVITPFPNPLLGKDNYLYELAFEPAFIGYDGIKLQIHFMRLAVDKSKTQLGSHHLFLSDDRPEERISNIPWTVTLLRTTEKKAIISIDKQ